MVSWMVFLYLAHLSPQLCFYPRYSIFHIIHSWWRCNISSSVHKLPQVPKSCHFGYRSWKMAKNGTSFITIITFLTHVSRHWVYGGHEIQENLFPLFLSFFILCTAEDLRKGDDFFMRRYFFSSADFFVDSPISQRLKSKCKVPLLKPARSLSFFHSGQPTPVRSVFGTARAIS